MENFLAISISFFAFQQTITDPLFDAYLKYLVCFFLALFIFLVRKYVMKLPALGLICIVIFVGILWLLNLGSSEKDVIVLRMPTPFSHLQGGMRSVPALLLSYLFALNVGVLTNLHRRLINRSLLATLLGIVWVILLILVIANKEPSRFANLCSDMIRFCQGGYLFLSVSQTILFLFLFGMIGVFYYQELVTLFIYLSKLRFLPRWIQEKEDPYKFRNFAFFAPFIFVFIYLYFDNVVFFSFYVQLIFFSSALTILRAIYEQPSTDVETRWIRYLGISLFAFFSLVLIILFREDILLISGIIFLLAIILIAIRISYESVDARFKLENNQEYKAIADIVVVPFTELDLPVMRVLEYAVRFTKNVIAINLNDRNIYESDYAKILSFWPWVSEQVTVYHIELNGKDHSTRVVEYLDELTSQPLYENMIITVMIPEFIPPNLLIQPFYADSLRMKLRGHENIILVDVRINV